LEIIIIIQVFLQILINISFVVISNENNPIMKRKIEDTEESENKKIKPNEEYIVVSGDRYWDKQPRAIESIFDVLKTLDPLKHTIVHGGCKGLDLMVEKESKLLGFKVISCPADWKKDGISAGPIRNSSMLKDYNPKYVYCFHNDIKSSKGTKDMKNKCEAREKKMKKEHQKSECKNTKFKECGEHSFGFKHIQSNLIKKKLFF
jgi:hypothetical protein